MNSQELLDLYRDGQSEAATAIFDRYVKRLVALARSRIGQKLKRRIDPEDVVQSAYCSFFLHAKDDEYQLARSGDLWRLLASITLHKLHGQIEKHTAAKRSIDRDSPIDASLVNLQTPDPSAAEVVAIVEQLHLLVDHLLPDERIVLTSTLAGQSIEEIAASIGKSARTARRHLAEVRRKMEQLLLTDETPAVVERPPVGDLKAPLKYADYVLEQLIGAGGMGKVFRAREKASGKKVAIKSLHKSRQSDARAVAGFVQEAQVLAKLHHPNIVNVQGLGRFPGGGLFMAMDFVDGYDLQLRLHGGAIPVGESIAIVKQVATAVQFAHERGIVHCDLKPANVLVDRAGHVFVADFGFAYLVAGASTDRLTTIGGTAGYIAPEVVQGERPTNLADVYSLGALLWALLTGSPACPMESAGTIENPLWKICRRCLQNAPRDRYQHLTTFVAELADTNGLLDWRDME